MAQRNLPVTVNYRFIFLRENAPPFIRELTYNDRKTFKSEWAKLGNDQRMYQCLNQNCGVDLFAGCKLPPLASPPKPMKEVRELEVFDFTDEQLVTNQLIQANGEKAGLTPRAINIYQLVNAGVLLKNIPRYLDIAIGTVYCNCCVSRHLMDVDSNGDVLQLLKALNRFVLFQ